MVKPEQKTETGDAWICLSPMLIFEHSALHTNMESNLTCQEISLMMPYSTLVLHILQKSLFISAEEKVLAVITDFSSFRYVTWAIKHSYPITAAFVLCILGES